jgi:predicted metal-binding protein
VAVNREHLVKDALDCGAAYAAIADTSEISFHEDFRKACEKNACGRFDTNWMGPPAIGPITELMEKVRAFREGLLFQTVHQLRSSFDFKGMMDAGKPHRQVFRRLLGRTRTEYHFEKILPLDAGCCNICEKCAYLDGEPCRHP